MPACARGNSVTTNSTDSPAAASICRFLSQHSYAIPISSIAMAALLGVYSTEHAALTTRAALTLPPLKPEDCLLPQLPQRRTAHPWWACPACCRAHHLCCASGHPGRLPRTSSTTGHQNQKSASERRKSTYRNRQHRLLKNYLAEANKQCQPSLE